MLSKTHKPSERGQALILIAIGILAMVMIVGLAVDVGNAFQDRRQAQNAADTAALTAALHVANNDAAWETAGRDIAAVNGYDTGVEVFRPPVEGFYTGNNEYIQVIITSTVETTFARVANINVITNRVDAVARAKPPVPSQLFDGNAVVGLSPHDCKAVKYQGNANTTLIGSGLFVNSDCSDSAYFSNTIAATLSTPYVNSVGGVTYKPGSLTGTVTTGAQPYAYPPSYAMPHPGCSVDAAKSGNTLSAGNYTGHFPPNGVTTLQSGVYCVNGDFRINANDTLTGHDVVIYMISGDVTWNGAATINLDAPDSGPFKGLLLYVPMSNSSTITINGDSNSTFTGTILAPSSEILVNGTGGSAGLNSQVIGYTVDLSGASTTKIIYNDSDNWITTEPPAVELAN